MKTLKLFPLAFLGLVLLAACQHKEEPVSGNQNITIKARIGSMTKVAYDGVATAFTAGDVLAVYAWTGSNSTVPSEKVVDGVRNTLGDDGKWTPATPMVWADATTDHYFIGVSPARDVSDFTQDSFTLDPSDYTASDLLIANTPNGIKPTDQPVDLSFDHMMAKLNVNLRFRSQWETTPTVSSITVTAKTSATVNYLTKAVTATGDATAIPLFAGSSAPEGYALSYSCLMIPQSGVNAVIITIDGKEYLYTTEEDIPLISGKITHLFIAVGEDKVVELGNMTVINWDEGESLPEGDAKYCGAINLCAEGTANCYIINDAGTYQFNGSVKGNSSESVGEPVSASVIWETFNTSTAPSVGDVISNVSLSNGFVQFSSTGSKGNALIAVKDAENNILWSWHIWVTDYDPNSDYDIYTGHESVKMMDRNLGAMSSEPGTNSIGLIYEWGRKDPFMGSTSLTSYSQFASTVSFPDCKTSTSTIGTEKYAAENPTQYIIANSQNQDWLYTSNNSAWSSEKSKNDPCPKGWKVPDGGQNNVWSSFPSSISSTSSVTWNSTYKGINVSESIASNPVWYPAQGYHGDSDTYSSSYWQVGSEGRYWTTATLGNGSDYFQFKTSTIETYHTSTSTHFSRANGMPVRCCSE